MKKNGFAVLVPLLVLAISMAMATTAQATTTVVRLVSNEFTSICMNPTEPGFEPVILKPTKNLKKYPSGYIEKPNYKPLTKKHKGPFPDTGEACAPPEGAPTAFAIPMMGPGGPGQPAGPYTGTIAGASWVSYNQSGLDDTTLPVNPPPKYYIYDAEFILECTTRKPPKALSTVVRLYADNTGSAFINGSHIGNQPPGGSPSNHFDGPPNPEGWKYELTGGKGLVNGLNVLQFVVLDETVPDTGLDFRAEVVNTEEKESSTCVGVVLDG